MTGNKGLIKVPVSCYFEYKGILIVCKGIITDTYVNISGN